MKRNKISVIGLGFAGLHTAVAFGKKKKVIGLDVDSVRIQELVRFHDRNQLFSIEELKSANLCLSTDPKTLKESDFHIIVVPTPVNSAKDPNLSYLMEASRLVAEQIKQGDTIVYESTVYPGATEEICIPILENVSSLKAGVDFEVGYSPDRINPGDKTHTFYNTIKLVSGMTNKALERVKEEYASVVEAGVYGLPNIKSAEAAKLIENTQRDVNIAFMNEISMLLHALNLDTEEILKAAETKWNFLKFKPGFVGGHCIGVVPYYFIHKAEEVGCYPELMITARKINDQMPKFVASQIIQQLTRAHYDLSNASIAVFGITYKENSQDIRTSKVVDLIHELENYGIKVQVYDPVANREKVLKEYNIKLLDWEAINKVSAIVIAVGHDEFKRFNEEGLIKKMKTHPGFLFDIQGVLDTRSLESKNLKVWRL